MKSNTNRQSLQLEKYHTRNLFEPYTKPNVRLPEHIKFCYFGFSLPQITTAMFAEVVIYDEVTVVWNF
jgi:hypothetical protein